VDVFKVSSRRHQHRVEHGGRVDPGLYARLIRRHANRICPRSLSWRGRHGYERVVEFEHAVVARVGDIQVACAVDRNAVWYAERALTWCNPRSSEGIAVACGKTAVLSKHAVGPKVGAEGGSVLQHSLLPRVGDVEVGGAVNRTSLGGAQRLSCRTAAGP